MTRHVGARFPARGLIKMLTAGRFTQFLEKSREVAQNNKRNQELSYAVENVQ